MKDVSFKDEGEFVTVGFVSKKAKTILSFPKSEGFNTFLYGSNELPKIDIALNALPTMEKFLTDNDLTWDEV